MGAASRFEESIDISFLP